MRTQSNAHHLSTMVAAQTPWASVHRGGEEGADCAVGNVVMMASQRGSSLEPTPTSWEGPKAVIGRADSFQCVVEDVDCGLEKELQATHIERYVENDLPVAQALHSKAAQGG